MSTYTAEIQKVMDAFPSVAQWFTKLGDQRDGMLKAWDRQLSAIPVQHVAAAVDLIIDGKEPLPANYEFDRLGYVIKKLAEPFQTKQVEAKRVSGLKRQASEKRMDNAGRFRQALGAAMRSGSAKRAGIIDEQTNAANLADCRAFSTGDGDRLPEYSQDQEIKIDAYKRQFIP